MSEPRQILIVDDEPNVRLMFRTTLESSGYQVAEAGDGDAALATLADSPFDLVLLDLRMFQIDGLETLRRMRRSGFSLPVVMITAYGTVPDAVEAMKLGAIDFLSKPVSPEALRKVVLEVLARHASPQEQAQDSVDDPLAGVKRAVNQCQFEEAQKLLARLYDLEIDVAEMHYLDGLLLELRDQVPEARKSYEKAVQADPHYEPARQSLHRLQSPSSP